MELPAQFRGEIQVGSHRNDTPGDSMSTFNKALSLVKAVQTHPQPDAASRYLLVTHSQTIKLTYVATRNTLREEAIRYGLQKMENLTKQRPTPGGYIANNAKEKKCKNHPWSTTHTTEECRNKMKVTKTPTTKVNVADLDSGKDTTSIIETEFSVSCHWIIVSGANQHMCNSLELMTNTVNSSANSISTAAGLGNLISNVRGRVKINDHFTLYDVMFVPGLTRNLISLSKIIERGTLAPSCWTWQP